MKSQHRVVIVAFHFKSKSWTNSSWSANTAVYFVAFLPAARRTQCSRNSESTRARLSADLLDCFLRRRTIYISEFAVGIQHCQSMEGLSIHPPNYTI